jgi:hypothetical protein
MNKLREAPNGWVEVIDEAGRVLFRIDVQASTFVAEAFDVNGLRAARVSICDRGPLIQLFDLQERCRTFVAVQDGREVILNVNDEYGRTQSFTQFIREELKEGKTDG